MLLRDLTKRQIRVPTSTSVGEQPLYEIQSTLLKWGYIKFIGVVKGDTMSSDYGSYFCGYRYS